MGLTLKNYSNYSCQLCINPLISFFFQNVFQRILVAWNVNRYSMKGKFCGPIKLGNMRLKRLRLILYHEAPGVTNTLMHIMSLQQEGGQCSQQCSPNFPSTLFCKVAHRAIFRGTYIGEHCLGAAFHLTTFNGKNFRRYYVFSSFHHILLEFIVFLGALVHHNEPPSLKIAVLCRAREMCRCSHLGPLSVQNSSSAGVSSMVISSHHVL